MPANLPPQYLDAEKRYRQAKHPPEKIRALEEMLALIPKHKGTEKLQADLKRRVSKLKAELERRPATRRGSGIFVEREGVGQVVLVGGPNVGKSSLLRCLTNARPEVAEYPFTTRRPLPGMLEFENVKIQLVDLPPVAPGLAEGWVFGIIRSADFLLWVLDLGSEDLLEQVETTEKVLIQAKILPGAARERVEVTEPGQIIMRTIMVGNKADLPGAADRFLLLQELSGGRFPLLMVSALAGTGLEEIRCRLYEALEVLRVYTKPPGKTPNFSQPVVLPKGSTLLEAAEAVHKDFTVKLKYARVWGSGKFEGQRVHREYIVQEGDVIEFHI
ncbi:MAG: GTPase [Candidatus Methylomirabilales bacterium]